MSCCTDDLLNYIRFNCNKITNEDDSIKMILEDYKLPYQEIEFKKILLKANGGNSTFISKHIFLNSISNFEITYGNYSNYNFTVRNTNINLETVGNIQKINFNHNIENANSMNLSSFNSFCGRYKIDANNHPLRDRHFGKYYYPLNVKDNNFTFLFETGIQNHQYLCDVSELESQEPFYKEYEINGEKFEFKYQIAKQEYRDSNNNVIGTPNQYSLEILDVKSRFSDQKNSMKGLVLFPSDIQDFSDNSFRIGFGLFGVRKFIKINQFTSMSFNENEEICIFNYSDKDIEIDVLSIT